MARLGMLLVAILVFAAAGCTDDRISEEDYVYIPEAQGAVMDGSETLRIGVRDGGNYLLSDAQLLLYPGVDVVTVPAGSTLTVGDPGCEFVSLAGDPPGTLACMAQVGSADGTSWISLLSGTVLDYPIIDVDADHSRILTQHGVVLTWVGSEPIVQTPDGNPQPISSIDVSYSECSWHAVVDPLTAIVVSAECLPGL